MGQERTAPVGSLDRWCKRAARALGKRVIELAAQRLIGLTGDDLRATTLTILWGSAVLSAIVDNIPFVAAMIPLIREIGPQFGGVDQVNVLWWALSLGACLDGNGTLIGASANLAVPSPGSRSPRLALPAALGLAALTSGYSLYALGPRGSLRERAL